MNNPPPKLSFHTLVVIAVALWISTLVMAGFGGTVEGLEFLTTIAAVEGVVAMIFTVLAIRRRTFRP